MVKLSTIYTRGGDKGRTSLGGGQRVSKASLRIQAIGAVDELNASLGVACLFLEEDRYKNDLRRIQNDLFDLGAELSLPNIDSQNSFSFKEKQVVWLEKQIDLLNQSLSPLSSFVLPGGTSASAFLHVSRTVARRAERSVVALGQKEPLRREVISYLNRLSDYLFVLSRVLNQHGKLDILWAPGKHQMEEV